MQKIIASKEVGTIKFLITEDGSFWFVSRTSCKYHELFTSDTAMPLSRRSVVMNSAIFSYLFAYKWTANIKRTADQTWLGPISDYKVVPRPRKINLSNDCFQFTASPVFTLINSKHCSLGKLQSKRKSSFTSTRTVRNLLSNCAFCISWKVGKDFFNWCPDKLLQC